MKNFYTKFSLGFSILVLLFVGVFFFTQDASPHTSELAFIEHSNNPANIGSVIPASCESDPNVANGDGNYTGCSTEVCWNGAVITPAAGESCPARPTVLCWNGTTITPSLGESCPPNLLPIANAGGDVTQDVSISVAIPSWSASASDPENLPVTISWTNTARPGGSAALSSFGNNPQTIPSGTALPVASFWSLDTVGTYTFEMTVTDSIGQTMTDSMNVNVISSSVVFDLTVTKNGSGDGTVTSNPGGINCGGTCSASFSDGTVVSLGASGAVGSAFAGWSGGGCSGSGACTVSMTSAQNVAATFNAGAGPSCSTPPCGGGGSGGSGSFSCVGVPANASVYSGDDAGLSRTMVAKHGFDTVAKCEFSCNSGFIWNGASCNDASASGGTPGDPTLTASPVIVPEGSPSDLTWDLHGQLGCILSGGTLTPMALMSNLGVFRVPQIDANTTFTVSCTSGVPATATVEIIPVIFET